jgi:hypothetical protein
MKGDVFTAPKVDYAAYNKKNKPVSPPSTKVLIK